MLAVYRLMSVSKKFLALALAIHIFFSQGHSKLITFH